ncbi:MAG: group I intron-associated PD-(D/E)XK endonuclease [Kofleriaceae bacterium]
MRLHHTKNKGDLGVLHAQLDLAKKGWTVLLPLTEHAAFDLVAYRDGRFLRVQVKYRAAVNGTVGVAMKTCWADRHGIHTLAIDRSSVDVMCVFCPDTACCYYVDPGTIRAGFNLRLIPTRNGQAMGVRYAADFTEIPEGCGVANPATSPLVETPLVRHSREPDAPRWGFLRARSSVDRTPLF